MSRGAEWAWKERRVVPLRELHVVSLKVELGDRKSTRLNSSHRCISYAVFCLKKKSKVKLAASTLFHPGDPADTFQLLADGMFALRAQPPGRTVYPPHEPISPSSQAHVQAPVG